jgi:hypothetical protein
MTARWEQMEDHITTLGLDGQSFSAEEFAGTLGVTTHEATGLIQAYLGRMVRNGDTIYVLHRTGRTKGAVWHVGTRALDEVGLLDQACDDMRVRNGKTVGALTSMARINPAIDPDVQVRVAAMQYSQTQLEYLLGK